MAIQIDQFPCRTDNFGVLIRGSSGKVALIDAPEESAIVKAIQRTGWTPSLILTTHHHGDHVEANLALKERYGLNIVGPKAEAAKIPGIDKSVTEGDGLEFDGETVRVVETPGHTAGHISYHFPNSGIVFTGDTLFAMGCGRLFESGPDVMYQSLAKLAKLPEDTIVYCGHEYTLANARFAVSVDPDNRLLAERLAKVEAQRREGQATLPTTIGEELTTNPFLRWNDAGIRKTLGMEAATPEVVFAELRKRKDKF